MLGQPVELTGMEFDILSLLITNQRRVLTYGIILDLVWKEPFDGAFKKTVINHIYNLRKKMNYMGTKEGEKERLLSISEEGKEKEQDQKNTKKTSFIRR